MACNVQRLIAFCILSSLPLHMTKSFVVADSTCGSLITYRQYSALLESAPQCFIDGCNTNTKPSSMSDICPQEEPCSELWGLFSEEYQQPWCSNCTKDVACRISGWPILNAIALCDITPDTWLFGNQGSCCAVGNQSYELARWVGQMCSGSEWRSSFDYYGGMAMLDWEEWLLPWNWTVRPENTTVVKLPHASCPGTPLALLVFAVENILFLFLAIGISVLKLIYIHGREEQWVWSQRFVEYCRPLSNLKFWQWNVVKEWRSRRQQGRTRGNKISTEVIFGIVWSILMTGLQVGFNFVSAYIIKRSPGYHHVPLGRLALLFCCRPRLSWVACLLDHIGSTRLKKYFHIEEQKYVEKAKSSLGSIGIGSAISEITLQGISSYYMVLTAKTGRARHFYILHHLRPFWRGAVAQTMYLGALFWLIACVFMFFAWAFVFRYGVQTQNFIQERLDRIRNSLTKTKETAKSRWKSVWQVGNKPQPSDGDNNALVPEDPEIVEGPGSGHDVERVHPASNNIPEGIERIGLHPVNLGERDEIERLPAQSSPIITNDGDMNERVEPAAPVTNDNDMNERLNSMDRHLDPQAYSSRSEMLVGQSPMNSELSSTAFNPGADTRDLTPGSARIRAGGNLRSENPFRVPETGAGQEARDQPRIVETQEQKEAKRKKHLVINIAFAVGLLAYIFQWMFWAGFVYTSGHRFCLPKLISVALLWVAALSGLGIPMVSQLS